MDGLTITEVISLGVVPIAGIVGQWIHMQTKMTKLESKFEYLEKEVEKQDDEYKALLGKIDDVFKILTQIKVDIAKGNNG